MADYIEREAAMPDLFCKGVSCQDCPFLIHPINGGCRIADYIKAIPAADVKPVVRCEECRHGYDDVGGKRCTYGVCVDCIVESDFYCAYGERGEDNG